MANYKTDHICNLAKPEEDVIHRFVDSGIFIGIRRKFCSWCVVHPIHPETLKYFKSHSSRRVEKLTHLAHHIHMIHPFSKLSLFWEFGVFFIFFFQFLSFPINESMMVLHKSGLIWPRYTCDTLQLGDVIKLFFTGYYNKDSNKVVLDFSKVAKRYLTTYFIFDIGSSSFLYTYPLRFSGLVEMSPQLKLWWRFVNRFKIVRLPRFLYIIELFRQYMGYSKYRFTALKVVIIFFFAVLWSFSIEFAVSHVQIVIFDRDKISYFDPITEIVKRYYLTVQMLTLAGHDFEEIYYTPVDYFMTFFFLCLGFILHVYIFVSILKVWSRYTSADNEHSSLFKEIKEYSMYNHLPLTLRRDVYSYFEFKYQRAFYQEYDIISLVSPILKKEILVNITKTMLGEVDLFAVLPLDVLMKLTTLLKSEVFLPGDVIVSAGSDTASMFFIYNGSVAVYTPDGKEICHLDDGAHFGDIALVINETRVATVVALSISELFRLKRSDFRMVLAQHPELLARVIDMAVQKVHLTIPSGGLPTYF